jgi:uncharacterized membrane protein YcfT
MMAHSEAQRIDWVDVGKGICIILVVMLHATHGVENALGQTSILSSLIAWAKPFRMPDFFLISGLFLAARINRSWRSYLDTKVIHFAYFYLLWVHIQLGLKAPHFISELGLSGFLQLYLKSYIIPFSSLWFIYLLAVFFVAAKLLNSLPKAAVLAGAVLMHIVVPETGIFIFDQVSDRFVFFYAGYMAAPQIFQFAQRVGMQPIAIAIAGLLTWGLLNTWAVVSGVSELPVLGLAVSFAGIAAVVALSVVLLPTFAGTILAYCGRQSIVIYLAFAVFMAIARIALGKLMPELGVDLIAAASLAAGIIAPLMLAKLIEGTRLDFLFKRPNVFRLVQSSRLGSKADRRIADIRNAVPRPQGSGL